MNSEDRIGSPKPPLDAEITRKCRLKTPLAAADNAYENGNSTLRKRVRIKN